MRGLIIIAWCSVLASLITMVLGHFGEHDLTWLSSQISRYAATAPYDYLITSSILLASFSLIVIALLVSKYQLLGTHYFAHFIPILSGAAASGLILLAAYEQTANSLSALKQSSFWAIRIQSFHDAGLLLFFYSSIVLVMVLGLSLIVDNKKITFRVLACVIFILGPLSYFVMTTHWPKYIGFIGTTLGLNQRAALFCLWLAIALSLLILSIKLFNKNNNVNTGKC